MKKKGRTPKKSANSRKEKEQGDTRTSSRERKEKGKGRQRKSNKRNAKTNSAGDQFNILDAFLLDTDDEHYPISASEKESESASSEDEFWK